MVLLGESGVGRGIMATLNGIEKRELQRNWRAHVDPFGGSLRPRFYQRKVLCEALKSIPNEIRSIRPCPYSEDTLIFVEASRRVNGLGFVPDAVSHQEEQSILRYARKWYAYGKAARSYRGGPYERLVFDRGRRRVRNPGSVAGLLCLAIRLGPFVLGYHSNGPERV